MSTLIFILVLCALFLFGWLATKTLIGSIIGLVVAFADFFYVTFASNRPSFGTRLFLAVSVMLWVWMIYRHVAWRKERKSKKR